MCPDKKRPAGNTCRIAKGLDAVWAHFCPSKPCLPLSTDGTKICDSAEFVTIRQDPSAYDIFFVNLGAFDADPYTLYIIPRIVNDTHHSYYHNEELNNLIIDSYTTTDKTKQEDELKQVARIVYDECGPVLGLYASNSYCIIREGLEGVLVTKGAGPYFRYASVDEAVWNK